MLEFHIVSVCVLATAVARGCYAIAKRDALTLARSSRLLRKEILQQITSTTEAVMTKRSVILAVAAQMCSHNLVSAVFEIEFQLS